MNKLTGVINKILDTNLVNTLESKESMHFCNTITSKLLSVQLETMYTERRALQHEPQHPPFFFQNILQHLIRHQVVGYSRYADESLLVCNKSVADTINMLSEFNICPKLNFTIEHEQNNNLF